MPDHRDLDTDVSSLDVFVWDAVPFVAEQDHGAPAGGLQARQGYRALGKFDGDDLPAVGTLLLDPAFPVGTDPVHARASSRPERVAVRQRRSVMRAVGDRYACADRVAGSEQGAQICFEGDPEWGNYEVVPAAVAAPAAATTNLTGSRLLGAQRARASALSSFMVGAYRRPDRPAYPGRARRSDQPMPPVNHAARSIAEWGSP